MPSRGCLLQRTSDGLWLCMRAPSMTERQEMQMIRASAHSQYTCGTSKLTSGPHLRLVPEIRLRRGEEASAPAILPWLRLRMQTHGTQVEYISYKIKINATLNGGHVLWQPAACPMIGMSHGSDGRSMAVPFVRLRCPIALTCIVPFVPCPPSGRQGPREWQGHSPQTHAVISTRFIN